MPLLAGVPLKVSADEEALRAAGWRIEVAEGEEGATVTLSQAFTATTTTEALAVAARHVGVGGEA